MTDRMAPAGQGTRAGLRGELLTQLRSFAPALAAALAAAALLIAALAVAARTGDRPFGFFSREPSEFLGAPYSIGFLFHVGVLVWWTSAVVCLFAGAVLARRGGLPAAAPLVAAGLLSAIFSLDDLFRIHEDFLLSKVGIPKAATYGAYGLVFGLWVISFRHLIRRTEWLLLALALALFVVSLALDRAFVDNQRHLLEDGAKFLGIVTWTLYFVRLSYRLALGAGVAAGADEPVGGGAGGEPAAPPGERPAHVATGG